MYQPDTYVATAGQTEFDVTFTYRSRASIEATVDGVAADFTWVTASRIALDEACAGGEDVVVSRRTDIDTPEVNYENTSVILKEDLNATARQTLDAIQEMRPALDRAILLPTAGVTLTPDPGRILGWDSEGVLANQPAPDYDAILGSEAAAELAATQAQEAQAAAEGLLSFQSTLSNTIQRTNAAKMEEIVSVADFAGANDAARLTNAFASEAGEIIVPKEGITISSPTTVSVDGYKRLRCLGPIRFTDTGSLTIGNGVTALPALSANLTPWSNIATFVSAHGLQVGDVFGVQNQNEYSFSKHRADYTDGQYFRVEAVISTTQVRFGGKVKRVFTKDLAGPTYTSLSTFKLDGFSLDLDDVWVEPSGSTDTALLVVDGAVGVRGGSVRCTTGAAYSAVLIQRSYDVSLVHPRSQAYETVSFPDDAYPINIASTQKWVILGGTGLYSSWHCMPLGGASGLGAVPSADGLIHGAFLWNDPAAGVGSIDAHGNTEDVIYSECVVNHANLGGRNITLRDCDVYGWPAADTLAAGAAGTVIYASEVVGGHFRFQRCKFMTRGNGTSNGYIDFLVDKLSQDFLLELDGCRLDHTGLSTDLEDASLIRLYIGTEGAWGANHLDGPHRLDVVINGMRWGRDNPAPNVVLALASDAAGPDITGYASLTLGDDNDIPGGALLVAASHAANNDAVEVRGAGPTPGTTVRGDVNVILTRTDTQHQVFSSSLTGTRTIDLPAERLSAPGDSFIITRSGPASNQPLIVRIDTSNLRTLWPGDWVKVVRRGPLITGTWDVVAGGQVSRPEGFYALGDENLTINLDVSSAGYARRTNIWILPLTANRTVTLSGSGGRVGETIRITRSAAATGAFSLDVGAGPLKSLAVGEWCDVTWDGSVWYLSAFGTL